MGKTWFLETRPHFLLITPVSVLVGAAVAFYELGTIHVPHLLLAFAGALLAHISVNVLNDYFDFKSGIDLHTRRTPFSGGSGVLPAGLLSPGQVYWFGLLALLLLVPIGAYFLFRFGPGLLPLGISGMILIYFYTTRITRMPWLCLLAPGLGFGPLMVLGTYFTQTGTYSWSAAWASLVPGFLVSNLLLLNQFPDVEADKAGGRRHAPIVLGRRRSARVYAAFLAAAYVSLALAVALRALPWPALLGTLTLPIGMIATRGVVRHFDNMERLAPLLAQNVLITLITPLLAAIGVLASAL